MWQATYTLLLRMAAALTGHGGSPAAGPLYGAWLGLYQTGTPPVTPNSTMANITEANYDGYSRQQILWFPPIVSQSGPVLLTAQDLFFEPIDALVANQILGCFIADAFYAGSLLAGAPAPGNIVLGRPSNGLKVQPQWSLTTQTQYGSPAWAF